MGMKKLIDRILEAFESSSEETKELKNLEIIYKGKDKDITIQVPDSYSEDDIRMYLDNISQDNMPIAEEYRGEIFGEDNAKEITDAYFEYDNLNVPNDSTSEPDIGWDKKFDVKSDKEVSLKLYILTNIKYIIEFAKFTLINTSEFEVDKNLEKILKNSESNDLHEWIFPIVIDKFEHS